MRSFQACLGDTKESHFPGAWGTGGQKIPQLDTGASREKVQGLGREWQENWRGRMNLGTCNPSLHSSPSSSHPRLQTVPTQDRLEASLGSDAVPKEDFACHSAHD